MLSKVTSEICNYIINMPDDEIFPIEEVKIDIPEKANIYKSIVCDKCGELTIEHRLKKYGKERVCIQCYESLKNK